MPIAPEYLHLVFTGVQFHAWLYGRNSVDPKKKGRSVADQIAEGRTLCDQFDWTVDQVFKDTGISASRHARRERDEFEELLETIDTADTPPGVKRILVAYEASRYYRDLEAYVRLRNRCHEAGVLLCYNGQVYDLSRREDRKATAMDAIAAEDEAEGIRDRNVRTARLMAEAGRPHGRIPWGFLRRYDPDTGDLIGQYEHPIRGPFVLRAVQHIDEGRSLQSLIKWLNSEPDAARPDGHRWDKDNVKHMLQNRAYIGERVHGSNTHEATWEAIRGLDSAEGRAMFRRVGRTLRDPARRTNRDTRAAHLLSNIALCGLCGDHVPLKSSKGPNGTGQYVCSERFDTLISERLLDGYVEQAVLDWFRRKDQARAALVPDQKQEEEGMAQAQQLLQVYSEELEEARVLNRTRTPDGRPLLSLASLSQKELELLPKIEELRGRLERATGVPAVVHELLTAEDPVAVWNRLEIEQRRWLVRRVVTVRLFKARSRGVRRIEPGRVSLSFTGTAGFRAQRLRVPADAPGSGPAGVLGAGSG
jgi:DNA invertase Pin-like site-specific DNA recombinase